MLKIKDNIDLKDLKKYGFKFKCGLIYKPKKGTWDVLEIKIDPITRIISFPGLSDLFNTRDDTLFDLIKAELVDKVDGDE